MSARKRRDPPAPSSREAEEEEERWCFSYGEHVGQVRPEEGFSPERECSFEELSSMLTTHEIRATKDGPYISRPMTGGDRSRSDANAGAWRLIPVDIDELAPDDLPHLEQWCEESGIGGFLTSTFSHREDVPKLRLMLLASRPIAAGEHSYVHRALERMVPFKTDPCMAKPSQPIFLPSCPKEREHLRIARVLKHPPLDVDRLLDAHREEIEAEQRAKAARAEAGRNTGVRAAGGLIDWFNANFDLATFLAEKGYRRKGASRFVAPGSRSGRAAVVLYEGRSVISFHDPAHDPLAIRDSMHQAKVLDAFSAFCRLAHRDDFRAGYDGALRYAQGKGWTEPGAAQSTGPRDPDPIPSLALLSADELYSSLAPQHMVIEGILDAGAIVICSGDSNSGKTTILQHLAFQVAQGEPLGTRQTKQGAVLWIAGEDVANAKYRVVAMCEESGVDPASIGSLLMLPQPVAILDPSSMFALHGAIREKIGEQELVLIIVDSKSVNWGGRDENSNDENASFVAAVRQFLVGPFGSPAVLITHHLTKQRDKETRTSRGGGALINNADHEWRFEMNQDAGVASMAPGSKVRMERWSPQRFQVRVVELPAARFPHLANNFGAMPRVSIAAPINQFNRPVSALQADADIAALLSTMAALAASGAPRGYTHLADACSWHDSKGKPDYRKARRVLEKAEKQRLVQREEGVADASSAEAFSLTDAGVALVEGAASGSEPF